MPHDANTFNSCDEMMSGWQDSFVLKLALQPVSDQLPIGSQSAALSRRLVAEDFTAKVSMKWVGDR